MPYPSRSVERQESGLWRFTGGLDWSKPASILGDPAAPAILRSTANVALADTAYANRWERTPVLDNVVFDGVRVDVNGPYKTGPVIRRSVFVNRVGDGETPAAGDQQQTTPAQVAVGLTNVVGARVQDSVFLSDRRMDGGARCPPTAPGTSRSAATYWEPTCRRCPG